MIRNKRKKVMVTTPHSTIFRYFRRFIHMAGLIFGTHFRITAWMESHGKGIGVIVEILSDTFEGKTTGTPTSLAAFNKDQCS